MKRIMAVVLCTAAVLGGCGDKQSKDNRPGLYVPAYSVTVWQKNSGEEQASQTGYSEYDKYDNLLAEKGTYFDGMKEQEVTITYKYSEDGRTRKNYSPEGDLIQTWEFNENGDVVREDYYFDNAVSSSMIYTYDEKGNLLTRVNKPERKDEEIEEQYEYEYDDSGKLTESRDVSPNNGADSIITKYTYDENGILTRSDCVRKFGEGYSENTEYTLYDKNGNPTEYSCISVYPDQDERFETLIKYTYNDDGKISKEEHFSDGELEFTEEYEYAYF